jgi:diaminopimelate decarboxylase
VTGEPAAGPGFTRAGGALQCEGVALAELAARFGTPLYVYSRARIESDHDRLAAAFAPLGGRLHFAIKANGNLALLALLAARGCGFDAVSGGEVYRALRAGADPARVALAGAGKTDAELDYALEAGVGRLIVEARDELARLEALAARRAQGSTQAGEPAGRRRPRVALRLNPGVHAHTHRHLDTGHPGSKFGIEMDEAAALFAAWRDYPHLQLDGVHVHIGSQNDDPGATVQAVREALALIAAGRAAGAAVTSLDIGGGFPVAYRAGDDAPGPEVFAAALAPLLAGQGLEELLVEPGRALVAAAGVLLVRVVSVKHSAGARIVVVDGGMSDLIRPALYDAYHAIVPVAAPAGELSPADVAGPICESADYLGRARPLPALAPGDLLAVLHTGAYGMSMASNYNARPRPAEVLVAGATARLIRRRERWEDLVALEEDGAPGCLPPKGETGC